MDTVSHRFILLIRSMLGGNTTIVKAYSSRLSSTINGTSSSPSMMHAASLNMLWISLQRITCFPVFLSNLVGICALLEVSGSRKTCRCPGSAVGISTVVCRLRENVTIGIGGRRSGVERQVLKRCAGSNGYAIDALSMDNTATPCEDKPLIDPIYVIVSYFLSGRIRTSRATRPDHVFVNQCRQCAVLETRARWQTLSV